MDPMTLVGILIAIAAVFGGGMMGGIDVISAFVQSPSSIILVLGGTIGVTLASGTIEDATNAAKVLVKAFTGGKGEDRGETIEQMVEFADQARRDGLLALEDAAKDIEDPFLKKGVQMAVDGADPEVVREILETEIDAQAGRHKAGARFFNQAAGFAPAMGVAGTVIGLIDMLGKLNDPSALGPAIAVAFITTLWGVFLANFVFSPIVNKLKALSETELAYKELVLEGILSIQAGSNPRSVADKLKSFLPPAEREAISEEKKSA